MKLTPGTVSKILWHFTGGPVWDAVKQRQQRRRKPSDDSYAALIAILKSKQIRLGSYREVVKVSIPRPRKQRERPLLKVAAATKTIAELQSCPVCCLADIPVAHLAYHAGRYGKIAIGFHREAAVRHGFNPVLYAEHKSTVLRSLHHSFRELNRVGRQRGWTTLSEIASDLEDLKCEQGHAVDAIDVDDITRNIEELDDYLNTAFIRLREVLAFVKTFDRKEFGSIYCEREWRATTAFSFKMSDVAMIVLPRDERAPSYLDDFVSEHASNLDLPRSTPIVAWEDLIEH